MNRTLCLVAPYRAVAGVLCAPPARAATLTVGPGKTHAKPCDAIMTGSFARALQRT